MDLRVLFLRSIAAKGSSSVAVLFLIASSDSSSVAFSINDARRLEGFLGVNVRDDGCARLTTGDDSMLHQPSARQLDHVGCSAKIRLFGYLPAELPADSCCSSSSSCPIFRGTRRAFFIMRRKALNLHSLEQRFSLCQIGSDLISTVPSPGVDTTSRTHI